MRLWPLGKAVNWLGNRPLLGSILKPFFSPKDNQALIIPVQEAVQAERSVVLPYALLEPLTVRSSQRFIMDQCLCRRAEHCSTYPQEIGCLFLGDAAADINPRLGRLVSVDEAMAHLDQAIRAGLTPLVVHSWFDAYILGIAYCQMLGVCFCCDRCCVIRQGLRTGPPAFWDTVVRLPGLTVTVGPDCVGCGKCIEMCYVQAISLSDGKARIGPTCKGCGRCAAACPRGAITLRLDDQVDVLGRLVAGIEQRTRIG